MRAAATGDLTKTDEAMNPMGNIRAKLSVKYKWITKGKTRLLRLISATSSYKSLIKEGVKAQSCQLYWRADGQIYKNNSFVKNGTLGKTISYTKPTFSNVTLMPSTHSIDPITAGVKYTLKCTRGVTIEVPISFK